MIPPLEKCPSNSTGVISQIDLASQARMSDSYLNDIERGVANVSIDEMELLAESLGMDLVNLLSPEKMFN